MELLFRMGLFRNIQNWLVVSNICYFQPYLGKISNLINIFQMGWNHQPAGFYNQYMNEVYSTETIKMDDLGGKPTIFGNTHMVFLGTSQKVCILIHQQNFLAPKTIGPRRYSGLSEGVRSVGPFCWRFP